MTDTKHCLVIGDINIDTTVNRDPFFRPELKDLLPIYDDLLYKPGNHKMF